LASRPQRPGMTSPQKIVSGLFQNLERTARRLDCYEPVLSLMQRGLQQTVVGIKSIAGTVYDVLYMISSINIRQQFMSFIFIHLIQGWAISGPRATCGPPQRFQWPTEEFGKAHQAWNFLELVTGNVIVQANLDGDLLLFLLEQHFSTWGYEVLLGCANISMLRYV